MKCITCEDNQKCLDMGWQRRGNHQYCHKPMKMFEAKCNKCGKEQVPNKEQPIANFQKYDCGVKCDCGGEYVMWVNGKPLKPFLEQSKTEQ